MTLDVTFNPRRSACYLPRSEIVMPQKHVPSGHAHIWAALGILIMVSGCAATPTDPEDRADYIQQNDPAEPTNRAIFGVNAALDAHAIRPAALAYRDNVPQAIQRGLRNAAHNLSEPEIALNQLLQGRFDDTINVVGRFTINSTLGLCGLFDVAGGWGLNKTDADFGQTFGVWGIAEGPFIELPFLGPSNPRDAVGTGLTIALNPLSLAVSPPLLYLVTENVTEALDKRAQNDDALDDLQRNSLDLYATLRSAYRQNRVHDIDTALGKDEHGQLAQHSLAYDRAELVEKGSHAD